MPRAILKLADDLYLEWTTVSDGPVSDAMPLEAFKSWYREEHGEASMEGLDDRIRRADRTGSSSPFLSLATIIETNHAGPDGENLTLEEIIRTCSAPSPDSPGPV